MTFYTLHYLLNTKLIFVHMLIHHSNKHMGFNTLESADITRVSVYLLSKHCVRFEPFEPVEWHHAPARGPSPAGWHHSEPGLFPPGGSVIISSSGAPNCALSMGLNNTYSPQGKPPFPVFSSPVSVPPLPDILSLFPGSVFHTWIQKSEQQLFSKAKVEHI